MATPLVGLLITTSPSITSTLEIRLMIKIQWILASSKISSCWRVIKPVSKWPSPSLPLITRLRTLRVFNSALNCPLSLIHTKVMTMLMINLLARGIHISINFPNDCTAVVSSFEAPAFRFFWHLSLEDLQLFHFLLVLPPNSDLSGSLFSLLQLPLVSRWFPTIWLNGQVLVQHRVGI